MPHDKTKSVSTAARNVSVPRFKGKTTFEIFENGKKVSEHTDTNMMTNMLQNIFSPPRLLVDGEYCRSLYLNNMPMYSKVLGGILLYEQRIEENADMCLAPVTNRCVGHAGGTYSGTLSTRGSLNETESGFIDPDEPWKGYRLVYDFGTDKANGTISCACLTSRIGGNTGYGSGEHTVQESDGYIMVNAYNVSSNNYSTGSNIFIKMQNKPSSSFTNAIRYLGTDGKGIMRFIWLEAKQKLIMLELPSDVVTSYWNVTTSNNNRYLEIPYDKYINKDSPDIKLRSYDSPLEMPGNYFSVFIANEKYYIVSHTDSTSFSFTAFDPITGTFDAVESRKLSTAYTNNQMNQVISNGDNWFCLLRGNNPKIIMYPYGGGQGEEIYSLKNNAYDIANSLQPFGKDIFVVSYVSLYGSSPYYLDIIDPVTRKFYSKFIGYSTPFYSSSGIVQLGRSKDRSLVIEIATSTVSSYAGFNFQIRAERISGYLASINNLSEAVTKTEGQTMKVTYVITPESE